MCRLALCLLLCCTWPLLSRGQGGLQPQNLGQQNYGGNYANGNPFAGGNAIDTTGTDSANLPDIEPETRWVLPQRLFAHRPDFRPLASPRLAQVHYWDQLDHVPGFVQTLGQTGKPYQVLTQGVEERFLSRELWRDAFLGRYDRYVRGPLTGVRFYDTRTPYVRVDYAQTQARTVITSATASQNITPRLNATLYIKRQLSEGIYRNFVTDHTQFWASSNYRSANDRYWLFASLTVNALNDQVNGGVPRNAETDFVAQGDLARDVLSAYNRSFFGSLSSPLLSDAPLERNVIEGAVDQYYHLIRPDSGGDHRLSLRGLLRAGRNRRRLRVPNVPSAILGQQLVSPFPTRQPDSSFLIEGYRVLQGTAQAEASYTWAPGRAFWLHAQGGLRYQVIDAAKEDSAIVAQNLTDQYAEGELRLPWLSVRGHLRQRLSARFRPERSLGAKATLYPLARLSAVADTASSLLRLHGSLSLQSLNPSLFQGFFWGDSGNAFVPQPNLLNQTLFRTQVGGELIGGRQGDTLLPMYLRLHGFLHRIDRQIYYDSAMRVRQAPAGVPMQWLGAALQGRLRLWRHFFLETDTRFQLGTVATANDSRAWLAQSVPLLHGRTSFYADYRQVNWAEQARFGLEVQYRSGYVAQAVDTWSGEFYPTNYLNLPYAQVDAYMALRLRGVYVFLKYQHVNEQLLVAGYYTTPFYPMWGRSLVLGLNWAFFN